MCFIPFLNIDRTLASSNLVSYAFNEQTSYTPCTHKFLSEPSYNHSNRNNSAPDILSLYTSQSLSSDADTLVNNAFFFFLILSK